ncbi:MAG: hypothetical protein CMF96_11690, partial [Candidatus Marinimicrobia bacterium]|nr:hypothetical protein [Candidatus Neomarinimicrobiota bacterium]
EMCCSQSRKHYWIKDTDYASIDKKFAFQKCRHTCSYVENKLPAPPEIDDTHELSKNNVFMDPTFIEIYNWFGDNILDDNKYNNITSKYPSIIEYFFNLWIDNKVYTLMRGTENEMNTQYDEITNYFLDNEETKNIVTDFFGDLDSSLKRYKCCNIASSTERFTDANQDDGSGSQATPEDGCELKEKSECDSLNGTWTESTSGEGVMEEITSDKFDSIIIELKKLIYTSCTKHFDDILTSTPYLRDIILLHFNNGTLKKMHREVNYDKIVDFLKNYTVGHEILKKIYRSNFTNTQIAQLHHSNIDQKLYFLTIYIILTEIKNSPKNPHDYLCCNDLDCITPTDAQKDSKTEEECSLAGGTWTIEHFNYPCCDGDNCSYNLNTDINRRNAKNKKECTDAGGKWHSIYKQGNFCPTGIEKYNIQTETNYIQSFKDNWCAPWEPETVDNCNNSDCPNEEDKYCPPDAEGSGSKGYCCLRGIWTEKECSELDVNISQNDKNPNLSLSEDQCTQFANDSDVQDTNYKWGNKMNSENKPKGCFTIEDKKIVYYNESTTSPIKCSSTNKCIELKTVQKTNRIKINETQIPTQNPS